MGKFSLAWVSVLSLVFSAVTGPIRAYAETSSCVSVACGEEINLVSVVDQNDEATLQKAALDQATSFRLMPSHLLQQGVAVTASQEERFGKIADVLEADAKKPHLKSRMLQELSRSTHVVKKASLIPLEALGYAGSVAASALVLPLVAVADFAAAVVSGKGAFVDDSTFAGEAAGYSASLFSMYYTWVSVSVVIGASMAPMVVGPIGIEAIDQIVCSEKNQGAGQEKFCATNQKILSVLMGGSARLAIEAGKFVHSVTIAPIGKVLGIHPRPPKPVNNGCVATCVLYAPDATTEVARNPIVSDSLDDLRIACSLEAMADKDMKPWVVLDSNCL